MAQKKITGVQLDTTDVTASLNTFTSGTKGLAPASGGGTANYLRADGTWAAPAGSGGTVTSVSVTSANGFAGTVATATTTPAITMSTTITGVLKGNGTAISAATSGTDYSAGTSALATGILKSTTGTGALSIAVAADFPTLNQNTTGTAANATNIAITNDVATATAVYPVWSGANTGNNAAKTSSTKLSFVPSTGILTAAGFAGPLNGAVGGTTPAAGAFTTINASSTATLNGNVVVGAGNLDIQGSTTPQFNLVASGGQTWTIGYNAGSSILGFYDATGANWGFYVGNGSSGATTFPRNIASTTTTTGTVVITGGLGVGGAINAGGVISGTGGKFSGLSASAPVFTDASKNLTSTGTVPVGSGGTGTTTAFTTGSVVFAGASGVYTQDNANFFWDDTNNRLGIGTATPVGKLDVSATDPSSYFTRFVAGTSGANIYLQHSRGASVGTNTILNSGDTIGTIVFAGANGTTYTDAAYISAAVDGTPGATNDMPGRLVFSTSADGSGTPTERMRIDSSGNVLRGTATSIFGGDQTGFVNSNGTQVGFWGTSATYGGTFIGTYSNHSLGLLTNNATRMSIDNAGNIGIGTSPSAKLHVYSTSGASTWIDGSGTTTGAINTGAAMLFAGHDGVSRYAWAQIGGFKENGTSGNQASYFTIQTRANGGALTDRVRVDSAGKVGIGTTPTALLHCLGSATAGVGFFKGTGATTAATVEIQHDNSSGANNALYVRNLTNWAQSTAFVQITAANGTDSGALINMTNNGTGNYFTCDSNASLTKSGNLISKTHATAAPTTKTANYSMTATDSSLIFNGTGSITLTLQSASSYPGRWLYVKTVAAQTVVSASSNVVPQAGGAAGTAILAATAGKWAALQSDGTNWVIMMSN